MPETFRTFQKFNDPELAVTIAGKLRDGNIESHIVDENPNFEPSFSPNIVAPTIHLKVKAEDFDRAHEVLEKYYQQQTDEVPPNYYLLSFSKRELMEIIAKPDEWGHFDYALAKRLLADRGHFVTPQTVTTLKEERLRDLSQPEKPQTGWIVLGYIFAIFGSFIGILIGYMLTHTRKTLPNGENVFVYSPRTRWHGKRIFYLGLAGLVFWVYKLTRL